MLSLNYQMNKLLRSIIQVYLNNFNNVAMNDDKDLTDKMYSGSKQLKDIYDRIPNLSRYDTTGNISHVYGHNVYVGKEKINMTLSSDDAYLILSTMDCARQAGAVHFSDDYSKRLWASLEEQLDKKWLGVSDLSDLSYIHQIFQKKINDTKRRNKNKK